jgi:Carboxymuconolactone decarboxylase family
MLVRPKILARRFRSGCKIGVWEKKGGTIGAGTYLTVLAPALLPPVAGRDLPTRMPMQSYYDPKDLPKFNEIAQDAPNLGKKFFEYYASVFQEGELTEREKALIALAVAHTIQCPYCRFKPTTEI